MSNGSKRLPYGIKSTQKYYKLVHGFYNFQSYWTLTTKTFYSDVNVKDSFCFENKQKNTTGNHKNKKVN